MQKSILLLLLLLPAVMSASALDHAKNSRGYIVVYSGKTSPSGGVLSSLGAGSAYHFKVINADYVVPSRGGTLSLDDLKKKPGVMMVIPDYYIQAIGPVPDTGPRIMESLEESVAQIGAAGVQYNGTNLTGED